MVGSSEVLICQMPSLATGLRPSSLMARPPAAAYDAHRALESRETQKMRRNETTPSTSRDAPENILDVLRAPKDYPLFYVFLLAPIALAIGLAAAAAFRGMGVGPTLGGFVTAASAGHLIAAELLVSAFAEPPHRRTLGEVSFVCAIIFEAELFVVLSVLAYRLF